MIKPRLTPTKRRGMTVTNAVTPAGAFAIGAGEDTLRPLTTNDGDHGRLITKPQVRILPGAPSGSSRHMCDAR
jgi:hypothetical protein